MTPAPLGERVARLETLTEDAAADLKEVAADLKMLTASTAANLREMLGKIEEIASALRSITHDASADSRRLNDVAEQVADVARDVADILARERDRSVMAWTGIKVASWLVSLGVAAGTLWGYRYPIAETIKRMW